MNSVKPGVPVMYDNDGLALQSFYNIFLDAHPDHLTPCAFSLHWTRPEIFRMVCWVVVNSSMLQCYWGF